MEITYKVEAKCNRTSGINVEFKGISNLDTAFECAENLEGAFPEVVIICEQTGEVVYSRYVATDFFLRCEEMAQAIFNADYNM